ncbi:hypothetical protein SDRG_06306 [Saprolegnia diclina VS20]|uniref:F-box domain-containing protein n=1 Tax=Saprolegnia diclina (strain VS20) TaxID=1156394 RepID=T0QQL6_SAPDV|nr:hypothetical protein SDRG_06306 [Saprolegnia diclina VS20]EQC36195.1 hypothetical protein SDRG_06306 [Saprolegnia diclina VS20]|eukprot:XP_008610301.1 hypothetical protein SDRG_06306 [Saprolegnia diclina VS20]
MAPRESPRSKARRPASDGLLQPGLIEIIARLLPAPQYIATFLDAMPANLWTPALRAFMTLYRDSRMDIRLDRWPTIYLHEANHSPEVITLLQATLPLGRRIDATFRSMGHLRHLVPPLGPALKYMQLEIKSATWLPLDTEALSMLLRQCTSLCGLDTTLYLPGADTPVMDALLQALLCSTAPALTISHSHDQAISRAGHHLATWLLASPRTSLIFHGICSMDESGVLAFCDALQESSTLEQLRLSSVEVGGFHGRQLPASLSKLEWAPDNADELLPDDAIWADLRHALRRTRLEYLCCDYFGEIASEPSTGPDLSQLKKLDVLRTRTGADHVRMLAAGLSQLSSLTELYLPHIAVDAEAMRLIMEALGTSCPHLKLLELTDHALDWRSVREVLAAAPRLPKLTCIFAPSITECEINRCLDELVAAGRHVEEISLPSYESGEENWALLEALAAIPDVPFVLASFYLRDAGPYIQAILGQEAPGASERCRLCLHYR